MSLFDALVDVELVVVDEEARLVYAWFGGSGLSVFDEYGEELEYFTVTLETRDPDEVKAAIARVRSYLRSGK